MSVSGDLQVPLGDLAAVRVVGAGRAEPPLARWIDTVLAPLAGPVAEGTPTVEIAIERAVAHPAARAMPPVPGGVTADGLWVEDHLGRVAIVESFDGPARVDARIAPAILDAWVFVPLLRAALWRARAVLVHAAAVRYLDRAVAISGWSGSGKSRIALQLLERGADLIADDWFALGHDGCAIPVTGHVEISSTARSGSLAARFPGRSTRGRERAASAARRAAYLTRRSDTVSRVLARVAEATRASATVLPLAEAFPRARVAAPARLDALLVLASHGAPIAERDRVPEVLAAQSQLLQRNCDALAALWRFGRAGSGGRAPFPSPEEEREHLARALAGTAVRTMTFEGSDEDVRRALAMLEETA